MCALCSVTPGAGITPATPTRDRLVRIVDADGAELSNPLVVDDVAGLAAALGDVGPRTGRSTDSPVRLLGRRVLSVRGATLSVIA